MESRITKGHVAVLWIWAFTIKCMGIIPGFWFEERHDLIKIFKELSCQVLTKERGGERMIQADIAIRDLLY